MKCTKSADNQIVIKSKAADHITVCGYASVFNRVDAHSDIILPGAFSGVECSNVKILWQHDATQPIGVINTLKEDDYGLYMEATINAEIKRGQEAISLIKQGAVDGLSIGFDITESDFSKDRNRIIKSVNLWEISLVTFPANSDARLMPAIAEHETEQILLSLEKAVGLIQKII